MEIRALTIGLNLTAARLAAPPSVHRLLEDGRRRLADAGLELQSYRLACQPFPAIVPPERDTLLAFARDFERLSRELGCGFTSIGPLRPDQLDYAALLEETLVATEQVFASIDVLGDGPAPHPSLAAIRAAAALMVALGRRTADGMGNLRFAALAGVPPLTPFFPAAYHDGGPPAFSIAWQAADLALDAFETAGSLDDARARLHELVEREAKHVAALGELMAEQSGLRFAGLDLSLAPFPDRRNSIGEAFERLGVARFGAAGTLFVAALITGVLREINVPKAGYSGLMLPVLEDPVLAERAAEGVYDLDDLLRFSAVCGTGLDVVPLPGATSQATLEGILLDFAALAAQLRKPLSARLMPLPGKAPGDSTGLDYTYFVDTRVLGIPEGGAPGLFAREARNT